jgi:ribosomal protein S18 acetylase RimI-like enzyme
MDYKKCSDVDMFKTYLAFMRGFSDYMIKFMMEQHLFVKRFFGPEGNSPEYSFIALNGQEPVGLILGGIKTYEGIKTMRCGAMCVVPEFRGTDVSKNLFDLHLKEARQNNCPQLFLEVLKENRRAIAFYEKLGYKIFHDLHYYKLANTDHLKKKTDLSYPVRPIKIKALKKLRASLDIHLNWQNDIEYIEKSEDSFSFGIFDASTLIASTSLNKNGQLHFLWVHPKHRRKGLGRNLLGYCCQELGLYELKTGFPQNLDLYQFFIKLSFEKEDLEQHEMYLRI